MDVERKNGIDEGAGNDVDEAGAFLEPGSFPGFQHGVGFVGKKPLGDEEAFEMAERGNQGNRQELADRERTRRGGGRGCGSRVFRAALKEDDVGNWFSVK